MKGDMTMSDSVTLRKTYGIVYVILSFVSFAIGLFSFWGMIHWSNSHPESALLMLPFLIFITLSIYLCMSTYGHFVEAGKYLEKEERRKKKNRTTSKEDDENEDKDKKEDKEAEEETEEIRDYATLRDSAQLRKTYGIINLAISFILFAVVFLFALILLPKNPVFLLLLGPAALICLLIYALAETACEYFIEVGMYIEKSKRIMER